VARAVPTLKAATAAAATSQRRPALYILKRILIDLSIVSSNPRKFPLATIVGWCADKKQHQLFYIQFVIFE
jgi:hypothetical protein